MTMNAQMMCFYNFFIFILGRALLIFTKMRYIYWYFPRNLNVPVYQCFTLSTLKNLDFSCVVGAPVSCTMGHYYKLTICMPRRRMGMSECVLK